MKVLDFYQYLDKLKRTKRSGWIKADILDSESVSDHSFSTAILSMILAPKLKVNAEKLIKMALIHDIGESIIGDVTWYSKKGGVNKVMLAKKEKDERKAAKKILGRLGNKEYFDLWKEIEEKKTREAILHKEIDRLDLAFQAFYNEKRSKKRLDEFFDFASIFIKNKTLKQIIKQIKNISQKINTLMDNKRKELIDKSAQILLPVFTILAFAFISIKRSDVGLIFNLIAQIFWIYSGWKAWKKADQLGVFVTAIIITIFVIYGIINYWLIPTK